MGSVRIWTYNRVLFLLVFRRELSDDLALRGVALVHSLVVGIRLSFFEPYLEGAERPACWYLCASIDRDERHRVFAVDKIKVLCEVGVAIELAELAAPESLSVDLQLIVL